MAELKQMTIDGKPATVGFLTEMGGDLVEPEDATVALVRFDDGEHAVFFADETKGAGDA